MYKKIASILFAVFFITSQLAVAQEASNSMPFQNEIDAFAKADSIAMPAKECILFVGSSSFRRWTDIHNYFPGYPILNRGFGGSSLTDMIYYANETIVKYKPKKIYIYCGENDIASSDTVRPAIVLTRFKQLLKIIRKQLDPNIPIVFVSIKASIARWSMEDRIVASNKLIKEFIGTQKHIKFLDVHTSMLDKNGKVLNDIFIEDNLHMNAKGYAIWQKIIAPTLDQ